MLRKTAQEAKEGAQSAKIGVDSHTVAKPRKSPPMRLKSQIAKEHAIQTAIVTYLRHEQARGRVAWFARINGGAIKVGNRWLVNYRSYLHGLEPTSKGIADLLVLLPDGRLAALEVKQQGEEPTPEQANFLTAIAAGGGIAGVVRSHQDARRLLFSETES